MLNSGWLADPEAKGAPPNQRTPHHGPLRPRPCGCWSAGERLSGTVGHRQAVLFGVKPLFKGYGPIKITPTPQPKTQAHSWAAVMIQMEDFIERTLRERRSLQHALTDIVAKYGRVPSGGERSMLERMIEVLKEEIALRRDRRDRLRS